MKTCDLTKNSHIREQNVLQFVIYQTADQCLKLRYKSFFAYFHYKTLAKHIVGSRDEAVQAYREWITKGDGKHLMNDLHELKNKVLGCWCHPQSCHGDVLSELVTKHCN